MTGPEIRRFLLAMVLMMGVITATNILFPPARDTETVDEVGAGGETGDDPGPNPLSELTLSGEDGAGESEAGDARGGGGGSVDIPERLVEVETPLLRIAFSNYGAAVRSVELLEYASFTREGPVQLVPGADRQGRVLDGSWIAEPGTEPVGLRRFPYTVIPAHGLRLHTDSPPQTLVFRYDHPGGRFFHEIRYTFTADSYIVDTEGELPELPSNDRTTLLLDLGSGLAVNELGESEDRRMMAFAGNQAERGIRSRSLDRRLRSPYQISGPLRWAAVKSKFFLEAILPVGPDSYLAGITATPTGEDRRPHLQIAVPVDVSGDYRYRAYLGPMDRERLAAIGDDLEEVNPYGWRFFRPIIRPFVGIIIWMMNFLHDNLSLGYGWVLIVIGVLMRVLMWPLYQKSMRAQAKNMAVKPLVDELKEKYKDDKQKLNQEMMKVYREQKINPLAGCWPMLLPWPVLIALFFVFQYTIQLRGQAFMWLPDLSAPDPLYILPILMGSSMFLLQYLSMKTSGAGSNPAMKVMYVMPVVMVLFFLRFASGLNLYYSIFNLATIPQQLLIVRQRKAQAQSQSAMSKARA